MITFKHLFGQEPAEIRPTCILTPFLSGGLTESLAVKKMHKGNPYSSGNSQSVTLICTRPGALFAGDAVLFLEKTPCRTIIFFGACGSVQPANRLDLGEIVLPAKCFALDSFSQLLTGQKAEFPAFPADRKMLASADQSAGITLPQVAHASLGSVYLEDAYCKFFEKQKIQTVDMECAAIFQAAQKIQRPCLALLYITDILGKHHPYRPFSPQEKNIFKASVSRGASMLKALHP